MHVISRVCLWVAALSAGGQIGDIFQPSLANLVNIQSRVRWCGVQTEHAEKLTNGLNADRLCLTSAAELYSR